VGIDLNGDQDFNDAGEGFKHDKEGSGTNYVSGVVYTCTVIMVSIAIPWVIVSSRMIHWATATSNNTGYCCPITYDLLDLKLFANDISFSKSNPLPMSRLH
jgi:hypothetical protein